MSVEEYKEDLIKIIGLTNNISLLKHWKKQLEWDASHEIDITLDDEELSLVNEGLVEYENGNMISLDEFIDKRK